MNESILSIMQRHWIIFLLTFTISYLIGGINCSIILSKYFGEKKDVRTMGSGNAGFTNALRSVGKKQAIVTFIGDFLKGILSIYISLAILKQIPQISSDYFCLQCGLLLSGFFCVLGHMYPCFFAFKGGKSILTSWAISLLIDWRIGLILILIFLVVFFVTKIISLASIVSAMAYPIIIIFISFLNYKKNSDLIYFLFMSIIGLIWGTLVLIRHKNNILNLIKGEEKKITIKK